MVLVGPKALSWLSFSPSYTHSPKVTSSTLQSLGLGCLLYTIDSQMCLQPGHPLGAQTSNCLLDISTWCHLKFNMAKTELTIPCQSPVLFPFLVKTAIIHPVAKAKNLFSSHICSISRSLAFTLKARL